jgi:hypothetical protein
MHSASHGGDSPAYLLQVAKSAAAGMLIVYTAVTMFLRLITQDKPVLVHIKKRLIKVGGVQIDSLAG